MRTLASFITAIVVLLATAGAAQAQGTIVFIKDREVWRSNPDGSGQRQVSHNATTSSAMRGPSVRNDGVIYAAGPEKFFYRYNADGSSAGAPLLAPTCGSLGFGPTEPQVNPTGGLIVYNYVWSSCIYPFNDTHLRTTVVSDSTPIISENIFPSWRGVGTPRWVDENNFAMIQLGGDYIWMTPELPKQNGGNGSTELRYWFGNNTEGSQDLEAFDYSQKNGNILLEITPNGSAENERADLAVIHSDGAPPSGALSDVCRIDDFAPEGARPRWSPDGSQIVWTGNDGVYVSPAPVANGAGDCVLQPRLLAAGAKDASWGGVGSVKTPSGGDNPTGDDPGGNQGDQGAQDQTPTGDTAAPQIKLSARGGKLKAALGKGYTATVDCNEACAVDGRLLEKKTKVASGKAKLNGAGKAKLKLKFTSKAKKALKRKRSVKLTLQVVVKDAAGNASTKTARVTLKR